MYAPRLVGTRIEKRKPLVTLAPRLDVRAQMQLRLLGHPCGFSERRQQLLCARDQIRRIRDPVAAVIAIPAWLHSQTLQPAGGLSAESFWRFPREAQGGCRVPFRGKLRG